MAEVELKRLLGLEPSSPIEEVASKLRDCLDKVVEAYDQLSRDDKLLLGMAIPLAYPDLSKAPKEALALDYVGAYSEGLMVKGVELGRWALHAAKNPFVQESRLGFGALGESEGAVAVNCCFTSSALWKARSPVVVRGSLGFDALIRASDVKCYVDYIGSICETLSGVVVAKSLGCVVAPSPSLAIYCVEVSEGAGYCTLIEPSDFEESVSLESLEEALRRLQAKYPSRPKAKVEAE